MSFKPSRPLRVILLSLAVLLGSVAFAVGGPATSAYATPRTDDYPGNLKSAGQDSLVDPWGFYNRECTSFVAWRLNNDNGFAFQNSASTGLYGNADTWATRAQAQGYTVNMTPAVGTVAWFNDNAYGASSSGHVAWVESVSSDGTKVTIEEYNWSTVGGYDSRTIDASHVSDYIHFADLSGSSGSGGGGSGGSSPPQILQVKRTTDPNDVRQVYAATNTTVTEGWWIPGGDGVHLHTIITIGQHDIVGFDKVNLPGGTQALYTAETNGVWETWWKPDGTNGQSKIVTGLSGVKGVIAYNDTENGTFVHHLYILAGDGPYEAWWKDGGDGVHLSLLAGISGGVTFTQSIGPDSAMQLYVAVPTWVYEVWWYPGTNQVHVGTVINIAQGDIRSLSKGANLSNGGQLLYTGTSTTAWQSYWNTGTGVSNGTIATGQNNAIQVQADVYNGTHELYLATGDHVQEYWWNDTASGGGTLITIWQNDIGGFSKFDDGAYQQVYTGAGGWVYETWWGNGQGLTTNPLFSVQQ